MPESPGAMVRTDGETPMPEQTHEKAPLGAGLIEALIAEVEADPAAGVRLVQTLVQLGAGISEPQTERVLQILRESSAMGLLPELHR